MSDLHTLRSFKLTLALGLTVVAVGGPAVSLAADEARLPAPRAEIVSYRDLDLKAPAGREALYHRLRAASSRVCGSTADLRDLRAQQDERTCRTTALNTAIRTLGNPEVSAMRLVADAR